MASSLKRPAEGPVEEAGPAKRRATVVDHLKCAICLEVFEGPASLPCGHIFCGMCLTTHAASASASASSKSTPCATCRAPYTQVPALCIFASAMVDLHVEAMGEAERTVEMNRHLVLAARSGKSRRVQHWLDMGADVHSMHPHENGTKASVLYHAISCVVGATDAAVHASQSGVAMTLLQAGAKPGAVDLYNAAMRLPVSRAVWIAVCHAMLDRGVPSTFEGTAANGGRLGSTALTFAVNAGAEDLAMSMMGTGAKETEQFPLLPLAARMKMHRVVRKLLDDGSVVDGADPAVRDCVWAIWKEDHPSQVKVV